MQPELEPEHLRRIHEVLDLRQPDSAPALIDFDGRVVDNDELRVAVRSAETVLRDQGVVAGDRVLLVAENCALLVSMLLACSRIDAWAVPTNARLSATELARITTHARPKVSVFTTACSTSADEHAQQSNASDVTDPTLGGFRVARDTKSLSEPVYESAEQQVATLMYTTGTTGDPKGVMMTHGNLLYASRASMAVRQLNQADHVYAVLPLSHIFGLASAFMASLRAGATLQLVPRFDPDATLAALQRNVTVLPAVPAIYAKLMDHAERNGITPPIGPFIRYMSAGGAPLDPDWKRRVEHYFERPLHNGYGLTETAAGVSVTTFGEYRADTGTGPPMPEQDIRLAPLPGNDEGVGEVLIRGPNIMRGYYRNPEATAAVIDADGFFRSGDLGRFDDEGVLFIVGRCKELIIRSGFNVYPPEVETALNAHPEVVHSAVVGKREPDGNEQVLAFVEGSPGVNLDEHSLQEFIADRLAAYKRPSRIVITEHLPVSGAGKVLKHRLPAMFKDVLED